MGEGIREGPRKWPGPRGEVMNGERGSGVYSSSVCPTSSASSTSSSDSECDPVSEPDAELDSSALNCGACNTSKNAAGVDGAGECNWSFIAIGFGGRLPAFRPVGVAASSVGM